MLTRRSLLRRAVGALAAGTLAGVSRWLPAPKAEDRLVLPEPVPIVVDHDKFLREFYMPGWLDMIEERAKSEAVWAALKKQAARRRMTTKFT